MVNHAHGQGDADAHFNIPESITGIDFATGPYYADHGNLNTAGDVAFSMFVTTLNGSIVFIVTTVFHLRGDLPGKEFLWHSLLAQVPLIKKIPVASGNRDFFLMSTYFRKILFSVNIS
jgi:hypothetical protein